MILKEFTAANSRTLHKLTRVLAETYDYTLDFTNMTNKKAYSMIKKCQSRLDETRDLPNRLKYKIIAESLDLWMQANIQTELTSMVAEGLDDESMEEAKVILAAKELSDKIQGMIEDTAKMQIQDLIPIVDAMKSEIGTAEADAFSAAAEAALGGLVETLKAAREEYDGAIRAAQGETPGVDMDMDIDGEIGIDDVDMSAMGDDSGIDDEFGGDDAEIGGDSPTGRELKAEL